MKVYKQYRITMYKVNINNIQGYDLYEIKKEEISGDIRKFPPVQ